MATMDSSYSKNLPAPKTFAPSREDVLSTLGFFFGDILDKFRIDAPTMIE